MGTITEICDLLKQEKLPSPEVWNTRYFHIKRSPNILELYKNRNKVKEKPKKQLKFF